MIPPLEQWQSHYGAAHRKRLTLHPFEGVVSSNKGAC